MRVFFAKASGRKPVHVARARFALAAAGAFALAANACGSSPPGAPGGATKSYGDGGTTHVGSCAPGSSAPCACSGTRNGTQECSPGGDWLTCQCNDPPYTVFGAPYTAYRNDVLTLDASQSTDAENDPLTFAWQLASRPANSTASIQGTGAKTTLVPDHSGQYVVRVTASDPFGPGNTVEQTITVYDRAPTAVTAGNVNELFGSAFALDASASTDPDGDALTPAWSLTGQPRDSKASITNPNAASASLTPDVPGIYNFQLTVFDGEKQSKTPATLTVRFHRPVQTLPGIGAVVDAERSAALNAVVLAVSKPSPAVALLKVDSGGTPTVSSVTLPAAPIAVSLTPDGMTAVVAHAGWVSVVGLSPLAVKNTWPVTATVSDIVADGNGLAYLISTGDQWNYPHTLDLATGAERIDPEFMAKLYDNSRAKLRPGATGVVYVADRGLSPSSLHRYDLMSSKNQASTLTFTRDMPLSTTPVCGDLWFETTGTRVLTACGALFNTNDDATTDMTYAGQFFNPQSGTKLLHADQSGNRWVTLLNPWNSSVVYVNFFDVPYGNDLYRERVSSPLSGTASLGWHSQFVFIESGAARAWVIADGTASGKPATGVYVVPLP